LQTKARRGRATIVEICQRFYGIPHRLSGPLVRPFGQPLVRLFRQDSGRSARLRADVCTLPDAWGSGRVCGEKRLASKKLTAYMFNMA